jgi:probable HAF family extracellular repeat protein
MEKNMKPTIPWLALGLTLGAAFNALADNNFTTIDFPGSMSTQTWGINSRGDIIGFYLAADKTSHGLLFNGGHFTSLDFPGAAVTLLNGINSRGDMVGEYGLTATSSHRGFLLSADGVFTPIDYPGATYTSGIGITARGDIVGLYNFADNVIHSFLLSGGHFSKIDYPGASRTGVNGISPQGDVVGGYSIGGVTHGFLLSNSAYTSFDYPNAATTVATGVNSSGEIVGRYIDAAGVSHGFLLKGGHFSTIDFPSATFTGVTSIDAAGSMTGRCIVGGVTHGFLMPSPQPPGRFTIQDLGVVGGSPSQPFFITNNRLVGGAATMTDGSTHAVLWAKNSMTDLGTSGLNSVAFSLNESAIATGATEISITDPHGEDFCGFKALGLPSTGAVCVPYISQFGVMTPLRTLGGMNGLANGINSRGQVAGLAENTTVDPSCQAPQMFQFKPALWENGEVEELPMVKGDLNGMAFAINENAQVAGASGGCSSFNPNLLASLQPLHALLWETGKVIDLGNLGGTGNGGGIFALNLNNTGQVIGSSDLPGDKVFHAFLWSKLTGMEDIGTLEGDVNSAAVGINDSEVVTGVSLDADFNPRAFIRRAGVMMDLNSLIPANSPLYLLLACSINSRGEITGLAVDPSSGDLHGYVATPVDGAGPLNESRPMILPKAAREKLRLGLGRLGFRVAARK